MIRRKRKPMGGETMLENSFIVDEMDGYVFASVL
jgi:hypothetical protein